MDGEELRLGPPPPYIDRIVLNGRPWLCLLCLEG